MAFISFLFFFRLFKCSSESSQWNAEHVYKQLERQPICIRFHVLEYQFDSMKMIVLSDWILAALFQHRLGTHFVQHWCYRRTLFSRQTDRLKLMCFVICISFDTQHYQEWWFANRASHSAVDWTKYLCWPVLDEAMLQQMVCIQRNFGFELVLAMASKLVVCDLHGEMEKNYWNKCQCFNVIKTDVNDFYL